MLFIIDMQNDFIDQERGIMVVRNSDNIIPGILEKIKQYEKKGDKIFYTLNIHENIISDNRSNKEKAWGQDLYHPLKDKLKACIPLKKNHYGITPEKASMIKEKYKDKREYIDKIELVGVETHICVLSNAIIIQNMFPNAKMVVDSSLCISNNLKLHKDALDIMRGLKMEVL